MTIPGCRAPLARPVPQGLDHFSTFPGATALDLSIPAGFFAPGSVPFAERVTFDRLPGASGTDAIIQRFGKVTFSHPLPSAADPIQIELVSLSLQSSAPITVTYGGTNAEAWGVVVTLPQGPQPVGSMTITQVDHRGACSTPACRCSSCSRSSASATVRCARSSRR